VALRSKNILESNMKTGIMNKDGYFAARCITQSLRKFRPEGLHDYGKTNAGRI
jgi:hypothetical protein